MGYFYDGVNTLYWYDNSLRNGETITGINATGTGTTLLQSAGLFLAGWVGRVVTGTGVPANTYVQTWTDASNIILTNVVPVGPVTVAFAGKVAGVSCVTDGTTKMTSAGLFNSNWVNWEVAGVGITPTTTVAAFVSANEVTLSATATAGTPSVTFTQKPGCGHTPGQPHTASEMVSSPVFSPYFTAFGTAYLCTKGLRAGDSVVGHVATTTFQAASREIIYVSGGNVTTGSGNEAGVIWKFGTKVGTGIGVAGKDGSCIALTGNFTLRGQIQAYGAMFISGTGSFLPFDGTAADSEVIDCDFDFSSGSPAAFGSTGVGYFKTFANNRMSRNAAAPIASSLYANDVFGNSVTHTGATTDYYLRTSANLMRFKGLSFRGGATVSNGILGFGTPQNWFLVEPAWPGGEQRKFYFSQSATQLANGKQHCEYWTLDCIVLGSAGEPLASIPVKFTDNQGVQFDVDTDSSGRIAYGTTWSPTYPLSGNYVVVDDFGNWEYPTASDYSRRYRGPFLLEFNSGARRNTTYPTRRVLFDWPYTGTSRKLGQYQPLRLVVNLASIGGSPAEWIECMVP